MRLIDADVLYDKISSLEAQAFDRLKQLIQCRYDNIDRVTWSAILTERTAFKYDVSDAPTVEIIECKNCEYSSDYYNDGECYCTCPNVDIGWVKDWNFYCKAAERKKHDT